VTIPDTTKSKSSWLKDLLLGFIVWAIAFVVYMVPAFVVAIPMGFDLGPKLKNSAEVGRVISQAISEMYRTNPYLPLGYIVILTALVFWRARVRSRAISSSFVIHGAVIAAIPVIMSALQMVMGRGILIWAVSIVLFLAAGIAGMRKRMSGNTSQ
jgi:hypothetical protein